MTHEITTKSGADHVYQITVNVSCLLRHIALTPPSGACARPPAPHCDKIRFFIQKIWRLALSCHIGTSIVYTFQISQWCTCTLRYHSTLSTINMSKVACLVWWFRGRAGVGIESDNWNILTEIHAVGSNPRSGNIFYFYFCQWCRPRRV